MNDLGSLFLERLSLGAGALVALRNINIVRIHWARSVRRFLRSPNKIISSVGQPILYLLALGFGLGPTFKQSGQGSYLQFLAPGVVGMTILFSGSFSGTDLLMDRRFGFMRQVLVSPVPRIMLVLGWILGSSTVALLQGTIVLVLCLIAGFRPTESTSFLLAFAFMCLLALLATSVGMLIGSSLSDFSGYQVFTNFLIMPMFFFSGTMFPLINAPKTIVFVAHMDPVTYAVDGLRTALIGGPTAFGLTLDLSVCGALIICLLALNRYSFSAMRD